MKDFTKLNDSGMDGVLSELKGMLGQEDTKDAANRFAQPAGAPGGIIGFLDKMKDKDKARPDVLDWLSEFLTDAGSNLEGAVASLMEAVEWNREHPGSMFPLEPYKDEDGNYGVRISEDALGEHGWYKDEETGQLVPDKIAVKRVTPGPKIGFAGVRIEGAELAGVENAAESVTYMPGTGTKNPYGKDVNVMAIPGVITDGNGHYYDAHDLPEGMAWDGKSKAPDVAEGYLVDPSGRCMTEEEARERYKDNFLWELDGDGTFINKLTGSTWEYNKTSADIKGTIQAARDIDGRHPVTPGMGPVFEIEPEPGLPRFDGDDDPGRPRLDVGPDPVLRDLAGWDLIKAETAMRGDWRGFGGQAEGHGQKAGEPADRTKAVKKPLPAFHVKEAGDADKEFGG